MKQLLADACQLDDHLAAEIDETCRACEICAKSGMPLPMKKLSIIHVNQAFNDELQLEFFPLIRGTKLTVIHMVDTGTAYSEAAIVEDRNTTTITAIVESQWFNRHGAPLYASGDEELYSDTRKRLGIFF